MRRAVGDLAAEVEGDDAIAGVEDQRHVVLDDDDRDAVPVGEVADERGELAALVLVETGAGLVEQHDVRLGDDRAGDADQLDDAVGKRRGTFVEHAREARGRRRPIRRTRTAARRPRHTRSRT